MVRITQALRMTLEGRDGVAAFEQMQASVTIPEPDRFHFVMHSEPLVDAEVNDIRSTPMRNAYEPGHFMPDEAPSIYVSFYPVGQGAGRQDGHTFKTGPGTVWIYDNSRPWEYLTAAHFRQVSLRLPIDLLPKSSIDVLSQVSATTLGPHALTASFAALCESALALPPGYDTVAARGIQTALVHLVHGIIQHEDPKKIGHRLYDYSRLVAAIDANLADPALSLSAVTSLAQMTEQQIKALTKVHVTTFAELLTDRRLSVLAESLRTERDAPIATLVARAGMSSRAAIRNFRGSFGMSMRDYRILSN